MSNGATLPAQPKRDPAVEQLAETLLEIVEGGLTHDEGAARHGCSAADLAQLALMPEIQQAFLASSAQSKRDGGSLRRRTQAQLLRALVRMGESIERLNDEDLRRTVDTLTRVLATINRTTGEAPRAAPPMAAVGIQVVLDPRGIQDARARGLTVDLPGLTDEKLKAALAPGGPPIILELGRREIATEDESDADGSL